MKKKLKRILGEYDDGIQYIDKKKPLIQDGLTIYCAEQFGGEGEGEEYWCVMSVTDKAGEETFWKVPGWYASHHGSELEIENIFEVVLKEKVIKVWGAK